MNIRHTHIVGAAATVPVSRTKMIFATVIGSVLEWYDFVTYAYLATYIAHNFFPSTDETAALLQTFATFGVGFLARPLGGWLFGTIGDRHGRKIVLTVTVLLMAVSTFITGILPSYAVIGTAAPVLLVIARVFQGLSAGGEATTAYTFTAESTPAGRRGWFNSLNSAGCATGILLGSAMVMVLTFALSAEDLRSWGWRIPLLIGVAIGPVGMWMRQKIEETPVFVKRQAKDKLHAAPDEVAPWRFGMRVFWLCSFWNVAYYVFLSYMPTFAQKQLHLTGERAFTANSASMVLFILTVPMFGALSDRIGRKKPLLISCAGFALLTYLVFSHMLGGVTLFQYVAALFVFAILLAMYTGPAAAMYVERFRPGTVRSGPA